MSFVTTSLYARFCLFLFTSTCSLFILTYGPGSVTAKAIDKDQTTHIGAIVHLDSRIGKQQKTAMEMAVKDFNASSLNHKLSIHFIIGSKDPLQSAFSAHELIQDKQAQVLIGMGEWQEVALLADVGNRFRVPIISLVAPAITPPFASLRWPYLVQMGRDDSDQIQCIADLVSMYQWRRVIVIYENEPYGGDSGSFALLANALLQVGSQIEYELSLPPLASLHDPKKTVQDELNNVIAKNCSSRVFIVLHLSQTLANHLFVEAKGKGLTGKESVWLITESIVDYIPSLDASTLSSMEGALGVQQTHSQPVFHERFSSDFSKEFPEEKHPQPGFHALRAYDAITAIGKATNTSEVLSGSLLSINFTGLSGQIYFKKGKIASQKRSYGVVNVVDKQLVQVDLWTLGLGFSGNQTSNVTWPGGLRGKDPKGWLMPTEKLPMKIGMPSSHVFQNFVKVDSENKPSGFCIELFEEVRKILGYDLSYEPHLHNDAYEELIDGVYNKTFDAAIGDFTALANRTDYVEFTQPFAESGLAMILPVKPDFQDKGWIFVWPFKTDLWIATLGILIYTMLTVWFLEHRNNPEFRGPWRYQLSTSIWFIFSSLFFAQREGIRSSYTRVVLMVWFFVVLILTQSYTADLSSMLTVARLKQNGTDIETLVNRNAKVGILNMSFTGVFLENVLKFKHENIINCEDPIKDFHANFTEGNMTAAFLEIPYARLFQNQYCDDYTITVSHYRFGGLSFVFPKGSPIAVDVSRAILSLTESGVLKDLENKWLNASSKCASDQNGGSSNNDTQSLTLKSFWGLFVLSAATCTFCLLRSFIPLIRNYRHYLRESQHNSNYNGNMRLSFASYIVHGESWNLTESVRNDNGAFRIGRQSPSS